MNAPGADPPARAGARPASGDGSISVVVPCHNAARYLHAALASILTQSLSPPEVIVVDDGSSDGSGEAAERFSPRVTVLRQSRQGIAAARNRGVHAANGALIAFLDADDLWPADSLERRWQRLAAESALDGVYGAVSTFVTGASRGDPRVRVPPSQAGRLAGALLLRREAFSRVGVFDTGLRVGETLDWIARASEHGLRLAAIDAVVLARRVHAENSVRDAASTHADYLRVLRAALARRRHADDAADAPRAAASP